MATGGRFADDTGASTVEAAFALAACAVMLMLCLAGLTAVTAQVRCIDAAREVARTAARGDTQAAIATGRRIAPQGAGLAVRSDQGLVVVTVTSRLALLPGLVIRAEAVSALEPS